MGKVAKKFKKGIASFYIVAFSTLILVIIVSSFAAVVISEIARTSNDDLSQSAYDAALAGVEDAKLAYANYRACLKKGFSAASEGPDGNAKDCKDIIWLMQNPDCDMVARILGRYSEETNNEVVISETKSGNNNMNQAYTCVKISTKVDGYRASLSSSSTYKVVKVKGLEGVSASDIKSIVFSWYSNREGKIYNYNNYKDGSGYNGVVFEPLKSSATTAAAPPTMALWLIQTANKFTMKQLNGQTSNNGQTDRATLYLVPRYNEDANQNKIEADEVASTNDLTKNLPKGINCNGVEEFACSVTIELPDPIGVGPDNLRNDDTFMFVVSLPYGTPDTDFEIKFCDSEPCGGASDGGAVGNDGFVAIENMQISIDSTGRANDLFRRVEVRMEPGDAGFSYPLYAIEATKGAVDGSNGNIEKELKVTSENNFD